jgi:hypothetical protein
MNTIYNIKPILDIIAISNMRADFLRFEHEEKYKGLRLRTSCVLRGRAGEGALVFLSCPTTPFFIT